MFKDTAEAKAAAAEFLPEELTETAIGYFSEEIGVEPGAPAEVPTGASKIGGLPDLPVGSEWPVHPGGLPYAFIAQINLRELVEAVGDAPGLPSSGLLSFFWDPEDGYDAVPACSRVIYTEGTDLAPVAFPAELKPIHEQATGREDVGSSTVYTPPQPVSFYRGIAPPSDDLRVPEHDARLADLEEDSNPLAENLDDFFQFIMDCGMFQVPDWKRYQILGAPCPIQPDPRIDANGGETEGQLDWILLLQVPLAAWEVDGGAEGDLYFFAHKDDLAKRDFSRARAVYQQT